VRSGKYSPGGLYVPYFIGNLFGHARSNWSDGPKDSSNHPRRFFRVDGKRYGSDSADTVEEWHGANSADALEERYGSDSTDTVERHGTDPTNALVS